jgi:hypothetical protein
MKEQFIKDATAYCAAKGIVLKQLSKRAVDDTTLFDRLQTTGRVTLAQIERIQAYMLENPVEAAVSDHAADHSSGLSDEGAVV